MILVDTSVWVNHLRRGSERLATLLEEGRVLCHPFVIGELACGSLRNRAEILRLLAELGQARTASHDETMTLVDELRLAGSGIGWIDAHLLASARLSGCGLWTADKALKRAAEAVGVAR